MKPILPLLLSLSLLSACVASSSTKPERAVLPTASARPSAITAGLEAVVGKTASQLIAMFGEPRLNFAEPPAQKLQFVGKACVLDAYLYPQSNGGERRVTHVDARRSDGAEVDRAACISALSRR
ncbi:MAG: hypothetical protein U5J78_03160 [Parasphingorhabdus sp.]|nr:hypothetical protein [Parasphingorhabdus sp.]